MSNGIRKPNHVVTSLKGTIDSSLNNRIIVYYDIDISLALLTRRIKFADILNYLNTAQNSYKIQATHFLLDFDVQCNHFNAFLSDQTLQ